MKRIIYATPVALAVAAVFSGPVFAQNPHRVDLSVEVENEAEVELETSHEISNEIEIEGGARVFGRIPIASESAAVVDGKQITGANTGVNSIVDNDATVDDNAMRSADGNIGANVAAGDNNQQANEAALAAVDAAFVFASAQIYAVQKNTFTNTLNFATQNNAQLGGNALANAQGNIGVNIAAGNSNQQRNNLAASVNNSGTVAKATTFGLQDSGHNTTVNEGANFQIINRLFVGGGFAGSGRYAGSGSGSYAGSERGNYAGSENGRFSGAYRGTYAGSESGRFAGSYSGSYAGNAAGSTGGSSWQQSNIYPDIWQNPANVNPEAAHPQGVASPLHMDLDSQTQGAVQNPLRQGVGGLAFDNRGNYSGRESGRMAGSLGGSYAGNERGSMGGSVAGSYAGNERGVYAGNESGRLGFSEAGTQSLSGVWSGSIVFAQTVFRPHVNNASMGGAALSGAQGNIGVNIAAGTNNQQLNSLAIAAATGNGGGGGGSE